MAKVIGKRILPGGNVILKKVEESKEKIVETQLIEKDEKLKLPVQITTQIKQTELKVDTSSFGLGVSNVIQVSSSEIHFRKFLGSGIVETSLVGYDINISAARAVIDASSLGGVSLGLAVSAGGGNRNELRIRGLTGGGIIEVSALANSIVISAASFTQNITNSAFGGGINPILAISANREIHTRTFVGGGIVEVSAVTDGRIVVSAASFTQNITVSSFGGGSQVGIGVSGNREIHLRTITGTGIAEVTTVGNTVQVSAARAVIDTSSLGGVSLGLAVSA
ncbi:MAG: hypothetical protein NZZ41_02915, partial [Candidatus Dojkabacteria bacterium]|nr:hypothetical protein [Candidatus Dojkabacteria bacterium]